MASIIEFRVPVDQFALAHTFDAVSELHVEIERFVAHGTNSLMPFVWVTTDDTDAFETALADDPSVTESTLLTDCDGEQFYQMHWSADAELAIDLLLEKDGAITTARTSGESWELQVMCPEHNLLSEMYEFCESNGLSLTVDAIYDLNGNDGTRHGLSEAQHTSLLKAQELGYYDVPRTSSLSELAAELGMSHQALSERLRRGHANLIDRTLSANDKNQTDTVSKID